MVRGIVNSILIPVVHGVFKKKFYGRIVLKFLEPAIRNVGKFTSASIAKIETKSTDSTPEATIVEEKYDRKSRDDKMVCFVDIPHTSPLSAISGWSGGCGRLGYEHLCHLYVLLHAD